MLAGHSIERKRDSDVWLAKRLTSDIADLGRADVTLKKGGEPAVIGLQRAVMAGRSHDKVPENPQRAVPRSTVVVERAVQEFSCQLR